jgi:signal transduction histidine kinase
VALLAAQAILIAGLLIERARRRQAEEGLVASQAKLRASYAQISDLGGRLLLAQERERARIARELHDDVGQQMALLAIDLELLGGFGRADRRRDADQVAREALERVHAIARSVHDLSHSLHPAKLRLLGLVSALDSLRRELAQPEVAITFMHENVPAVLTEDLTLCLFRVVQEALQNAIKHSGARQISVRLIGGNDGLSLTISDDGCGFDTDKVFARGLGLISMNERLESIGGTLRIQSAPGAGTRLEAAVPFRADQYAETVAV